MRQVVQCGPDTLSLANETTMPHQTDVAGRGAAAAMILLLLSLLVPGHAAADSPLLLSTPIGGPGDDDQVVGVRVQSDGTVVVATNVAPGTRFGDKVIQGNAVDGTVGAVIRLKPDGSEVLSLLPISAKLHDLALDEHDRLYVAAGQEGVAVIDAAGRKGLRVVNVGGNCTRVDATGDGASVALAGNTATLIAANGRRIQRVKGKGYTEDVALHADSKTIILTGFTNNRAFDGNKTNPVQICYVWGYGFDGQRKYTLYDWSTDRESDRFLNKPTNNMADTRGYRCAIGRDGRLYVAFEAAGGNHLFRYSTTDITEPFKLVGGDAYYSFHNSRSEHKTVFGRYDPATGEALAIQQFCGRLSSGRANAVRVEDGDITADAKGNVVLVGRSASGLPVNQKLEGAGDYEGGAFILIMNADLSKRVLCTYIGGGNTTAADLRPRDGGGATLAFGGQGPDEDKPMHITKPQQDKRFGKDGFIATAILK